jgi:TonB family protein
MDKTANRFRFETISRKGTELNRYALYSVVFHVVAVVLILFVTRFNGKAVTKVNPYIFEMVTPTPVSRVKPQPRAASKPIVKQSLPKPLPVPAKQEKSWDTKKKEEKTTEKVIEQTTQPEESPGWDEIAEPVSKESSDAASVTNEMTIQQPDFPYSYYGAQIRNAVEQNWRQTPKELLGSESQLVVLVKFTILKNGKISGLEIVESSWNSLLDKFAMRAVDKARIPPLPGDYQELTVHYKLVLRRNK